MGTESKHFLWRKLHSFAGLIPVGLFLLEHLTVNSFSLKGDAAFNNAVAVLQSIPLLPFVELIFIAIPIAFHAFYGLWIVYLSKNNVLEYKYLRNWLFYLQRVTAIITFVFVAYHVYTLRISKAIFGLEISFNTMTAILSNPYILAFYILGLLAAVYHLANGLVTFFITWGITVGPFSQRVATALATLLFFSVSTLGILSLLAFI